jgi:hypothetical protein
MLTVTPLNGSVTGLSSPVKFGLDIDGSPAKTTPGTWRSKRVMKFWAAEKVDREVRTYTRREAPPPPAEGAPVAAKSAIVRTSVASSILLPPLL